MAAAYLPPMAHVLPLAIIRRERRLPLAGVIAVRINQKVTASDVVAEGEAPPRHVFLDLARGLGVPVHEVGRYLRCQRGDALEAGDVLAGPAGMGRRTVRAPSDGIVVSISRGRLLFRMHLGVIEVKAGFPATVIGTDGVQTVLLETTGALIQGVWGNGHHDFGVMRFVGDGPGDRLQADRLDVDLRGAILVGGICDHPAPLHQATELSTRGIVLGGLSSDLIPLAARLPYPVIVTTGFGPLPLDTQTYRLLSSNAGREVALDARKNDPLTGAKPEVVIPLPPTSDADLPEEVIPLKEGVRVRLSRQPYHGAVGVVQEMLAKAVDFPSGVLARSARVDLEGVGTKIVPVDNLEVLQ
jgi:hypothetical protein